MLMKPTRENECANKDSTPNFKLSSVRLSIEARRPCSSRAPALLSMVQMVNLVLVLK